MIDETISSLKKSGFSVTLYPNQAKAKDAILNLAKPFKTIGIGGSITIRQMGLPEALKRKEHILFDHWQGGLTKEDITVIRRKQLTSELFLTSAAAITADGQILNTDGIGNRTGAMCFGPTKVIIVVGVNKIVSDIERAILRRKEIAGPKRAKSLGLDTPCVKTGRCQDCDHPQRICRITVILHRRPALTDVNIIIINEDMGY